MFLFSRSPRGGQRLADLNVYPVPRVDKENFHLDPDEQHHLVQDFYCLKLGYASKQMEMGESVFIKYSDAKHLFKLLAKEFDTQTWKEVKDKEY